MAPRDATDVGPVSLDRVIAAAQGGVEGTRNAARQLPMPSPRRFTALAALLACTALPAGAAGAAPHVTIVSDSVLTAVTWGNVAAQTALDQNLDVQVDAGVCRRLNVQSCEFNGGVGAAGPGAVQRGGAAAG